MIVPCLKDGAVMAAIVLAEAEVGTCVEVLEVEPAWFHASDAGEGGLLVVGFGIVAGDAEG